MAVIAELLEPIVRLMLSKILTSQVVQNDDTTVPVQDHDGKGIETGRLWVSIGGHDHPYTVYTYMPDRSATGPAEIFKDFKGYLHADAYSAYDGLYKSGGIVEVGCMMHARRKFYEARTSDPQRSHQALAWISLLYDVERGAKEREPIDYEAFVALRHELRGERSRPIFDKFLELDNGACERALEPVAIGRKDWLFAGSDKGGETAAILMSLCTTCKNLRIDPQAYLHDVLDRLSTHPAKRIEELLPDRWQELRQASDARTD